MNKAIKTYKSIGDKTDSVPDDNIINDFLVKNSLTTIKKRQEKALFLHIAKENDFSVQKIVRSTKKPQLFVYRQLKKYGLERK